MNSPSQATEQNVYATRIATNLDILCLRLGAALTLARQARLAVTNGNPGLCVSTLLALERAAPELDAPLHTLLMLSRNRRETAP